MARIYADRSSNKRRRDSGAIKDLRNELQDTLDEIAIHVDAVLDEWLVVADNGKISFTNQIQPVHQLTR
jgi:hypothetical protein